MEEKDKIIEQAIEALKQQNLPAEPPAQLLDATLSKIQQADENTKRTRPVFSAGVMTKLTKIAAAAILLITAGFTAGRFMTPEQPDITELTASIEPAIREQMMQEMAQSYLLLRDELTQQYQEDLREAATQILTASGLITNQLLEELILSIDQAQQQDRRWYVTALQQIEQNRIEDTDTLGSALISFAQQTEQQLQQTQQSVVQIANFLSNDRSESLIQNEPENINN